MDERERATAPRSFAPGGLGVDGGAGRGSWASLCRRPASSPARASRARTTRTAPRGSGASRREKGGTRARATDPPDPRSRRDRSVPSNRRPPKRRIRAFDTRADPNARESRRRGPRARRARRNGRARRRRGDGPAANPSRRRRAESARGRSRRTPRRVEARESRESRGHLADCSGHTHAAEAEADVRTVGWFSFSAIFPGGENGAVSSSRVLDRSERRFLLSRKTTGRSTRATTSAHTRAPSPSADARDAAHDGSLHWLLG